MQWNNSLSGSVGRADGDEILRLLWHDGVQFVCTWDGLSSSENWILDPVPDLAAAKAVVESWETPEGWEDDDS